MRRWKQVLWWRVQQQSRSYHWSHFAFSRRPPLTGWTQVSSRSWWTLRKQQHRCHHAAPQGVIQRKSASDAEVFLAWSSNQDLVFKHKNYFSKFSKCPGVLICAWGIEPSVANAASGPDTQVALPLALAVLELPVVLVHPVTEHMMSVTCCYLQI